MRLYAVCSGSPLGLKSNALPDGSLSASSAQQGYEAKKGRLADPSGWRPMVSDDSQYFQVTFNTAGLKMVGMIDLQGSPGNSSSRLPDCWVTAFTISYRVHQEAWENYTVGGIVKVHSQILSVLPRFGPGCTFLTL